MRQHLFFLAELLSPYDGGCPDAGRVAAIDWHCVTYLSGCYLVTPSLAFRVEQCGLMEQIPPDVADELRTIAANASLRNQLLRVQLAEIAAAFDAAALDYALLKGGAHLVLPVYPRPSLRVMADLDLLVAEADLTRACRVLERMDYRPLEEAKREQIPASHRHLAPYFTDRHIAAVELHRAALPVHLGAGAPGVDLLQRRNRHRESGQDYYTLSTTDRILVLIMHTDVVDSGYAKGFIALRALEEYAYTVKADGSAIRWPLLFEIFSGVRRLHVLSSFLWLANRLLGVPMPEPLTRRSPVRPRLHYLRCLLQLESPLADRWLRRWSYYSGASSLNRLGPEPGIKGRSTQRLHAMRGVLRRRLRRG